MQIDAEIHHKKWYVFIFLFWMLICSFLLPLIAIVLVVFVCLMFALSVSTTNFNVESVCSGRLALLQDRQSPCV